MDMFEDLMGEIEYAKTSVCPRLHLYEAYGAIKMAFELKAISINEYLKLNDECVVNGINNPKYFD